MAIVINRKPLADRIRWRGKQPIPRRRHLQYSIMFSIAMWCVFIPVLTFLVSLLYSPTWKAEELLLAGLLGAIPCGIFFGIPFGIALHRWMRVEYSEHGAEIMPMTWAAEYGKYAQKFFIIGGIVFGIILLCLIPMLFKSS
ncbi:MAG: hypothetical protein ACYS8W_02365 [Planctomycetota bacterium]